MAETPFNICSAAPVDLSTTPNARSGDRIVRSIVTFIEGFGEQINRSGFGLLCFTSAVYFTGAWAQAARKPLWFDELFTYYLSGLPTWSDLRSALRQGADLTPLLFHAITRLSAAMFGRGQCGLRIPEIIGFWTMCCCLFRFTSKRHSRLYAITAMLLPLFTASQYYATEARPYGVVLGFCGLALVCWQAAAERRSPLPVIGLAASIAAAVSCQLYSAFVVLPLGLGELARSWRSRRTDLLTWVALFLGLTPLAILGPGVAENARAYAGNQWATPGLGSGLSAYSDLLQPIGGPVAAVAAAIVLLFLTHQSQKPSGTVGLWIDEHVAIVAFLAFPICQAVSSLTTGYFVSRYSIPVVIGYAAIIPLIMSMVRHKKQLFMSLSLLVLYACFLELNLVKIVRALSGSRTPEFAEIAVSGSESSLPIVVQEPLSFLELLHYSSPAMASRLKYLADPAAARLYTGSDSADRGLLALQKWVPIHVEDPKCFLAANERFLLYWQPGPFGWLLSELSEHGAEMRVLNAQNGGLWVIAVSNPEHSLAAAADTGGTSPQYERGGKNTR